MGTVRTPHKTAFVHWDMLLTVPFIIVFWMILYAVIRFIAFANARDPAGVVDFFFSASLPWWASLWLFFVLTLTSILFLWYARSVAYAKERYEFLPDRIIVRGGGIFNDWQTELIIKNVTHVDCTKPWIQHKIFGTALITIQSASGIARLRSVIESDAIIEDIRSSMRKNGFSLQQKKLIRHDTPNPMAIIRELLMFLPILLFVGGPLLFPIIPLITSAIEMNALFGLSLLFLLFLFVLGILLFFILRYLDLRRRTYDVYDDVIIYHEGFLTVNDAFIPIENMTDATLNQGLLDQLFGTADVHVSCQGMTQEIAFRNMKDGKGMTDAIDSIVGKRTPAKVSVGVKTASVAKTALSGEKPAKAARSTIDTRFTGEYKQKLSRVLFGNLIMLGVFCIAGIIAFLVIDDLSVLVGSILQIMFLAMFFAFSLVSTFIAALVTTYRVKERSVEQEYAFLTRKVNEFQADKLTGIVIKESLIDSWFDVVTITFWSIGSANSVVFKHVPKSETLIAGALAKAGITQDAVIYEATPRFSVASMCAKDLFVVLAGIVGFIITLALSLFAMATAHPLFILIPIAYLLIAGCIIWYLSLYYDRAHLICGKNTITYTEGFFVRQTYYAQYDDVKNVTATKYPLSGKGSVMFNVAGDEIVQQGKSTAIVTHGFKVKYLENIENKDELFDLMLAGERNPAKLAQAETGKVRSTDIVADKESICNAVVLPIIPLLILSAAGPFLIRMAPDNPVIVWMVGLTAALMACILLWLAISAAMTSYHVQDWRVVRKWGIIYRSQVSIVYEKIDIVNMRQGALNKLFGNGTVTIHTAGSTNTMRPEMVLADTASYTRMHQEIKARYK